MCVVCVLFMSFLVVAGGSTVTRAQSPLVLQFWHNQSPQSIRHEAATMFSKRVDELTQGAVKVEVFPGGVMGDIAGNLTGLKTGANQFAAEDPGSVLAFDPLRRVGVISLPYLFETYPQAWAFMDSDARSKITAHLPKEAGFRVLAVWENGLRQISNNKRPVRHPKDLQGLKLRVEPDPIMTELMKLLGANPVPMAFSELYTAMQHGVVDGQDNPIANVWFAKFFEVQKYLSLTAHRYSSLLFMVSETTWSRLSPEHQTALRRAADEAKWFMRRKTAGSEPSFLRQMKAAGLQVIEDVDRTAFREAARPIYSRFESTFGKEWVHLVLDEAAKARAKYPPR
jgi:tripartite ATP-independent transporter DctP family solute receptor